MNKFIEREREIEQTVKEYKDLIKEELGALSQEHNEVSTDLEIAEKDIKDLDDRIYDNESEVSRLTRRVEELEEEMNTDMNDLLPHGETFDDIVFTDNVEDQVKDILDDVLEDKVKEIFENDIKDKISEVFAGSEIEFNQEVMNGIMRGIARKIYNLIASV